MSRRSPNRAIRPKKVLVENFVGEWRLFRRFKSQTALAEKAGLPAQTICRLEKKTMAYTHASLKALAKVLDCTEGDLISTDPFKKDPRLWEEILKRLSPEDRSLVLGYAQGLLSRYDESHPAQGS